MIEYRDVEGFSGYRVGSDGSVWSRRGRLRVWLNGNVAKVSLGARGRGKAVSHLVLTAFVGHRPRGSVCCHFPDRDPMNCAVDNIRWGTVQDNADDRRRHGTLPCGERNGSCRVSDAEVEIIRVMVGSQRMIAARFGITQAQVSNIRRGASRCQ